MVAAAAQLRRRGIVSLCTGGGPAALEGFWVLVVGGGSVDGAKERPRGRIILCR
jgi:hypothetical protein